MRRDVLVVVVPLHGCLAHAARRRTPACPPCPAPPPRCLPHTAPLAVALWRSNFYERLKEVREYHRKFPDDELTEVWGGCHEPAAAAAVWWRVACAAGAAGGATAAAAAAIAAQSVFGILGGFHKDARVAWPRWFAGRSAPISPRWWPHPLPPSLPPAPPRQAENDAALLAEAPTVAFSGEEALGRFLDLHELFHAYTNSKFGKQASGRQSSFRGTAGWPACL